MRRFLPPCRWDSTGQRAPKADQGRRRRSPERSGCGHGMMLRFPRHRFTPGSYHDGRCQSRCGVRRAFDHNGNCDRDSVGTSTKPCESLPERQDWNRTENELVPVINGGNGRLSTLRRFRQQPSPSLFSEFLIGACDRSRAEGRATGSPEPLPNGVKRPPNGFPPAAVRLQPLPAAIKQFPRFRNLS